MEGNQIGGWHTFDLKILSNYKIVIPLDKEIRTDYIKIIWNSSYKHRVRETLGNKCLFKSS